MPHAPSARVFRSVATLVATFALVAAKPSDAKVPFIPLCSVPSGVVGSASGSAGECQVVIHDATNVPIASGAATLDLSQTSFRLYSDQESGATVDCVARTVSKLTDLYGTAVFRPRFGGTDPAGRIIVSSEGVILAHVPGRSTDLDGLDGTTGLSDFATFSARFAAMAPAPAMNFDQSASDVPDLADFATFALEYSRGVHGNYCP